MQLGFPLKQMQHHQTLQPSASNIQRSARSAQSAAGSERDLKPLKPKGASQDDSNDEVNEQQFQGERSKPDMSHWQSFSGQWGEKAACVKQLPSEDWNAVTQAGNGVGDARQPGQLPQEGNPEEIEKRPCKGTLAVSATETVSTTITGDACQPVQLPPEENLEEIGTLLCEGSGKHAPARFYSWEEMTTPTVWQRLGIPPHKREQMLSPRTFSSVFGMQQYQFEKLPQWKKDAMKKQHGLF